MGGGGGDLANHVKLTKMKEKFELFAINPNLEFFQPTSFTSVGMFNKCGSATTLEETMHCNHEQTYCTRWQ